LESNDTPRDSDTRTPLRYFYPLQARTGNSRLGNTLGWMMAFQNIVVVSGGAIVSKDWGAVIDLAVENRSVEVGVPNRFLDLCARFFGRPELELTRESSLETFVDSLYRQASRSGSDPEASTPSSLRTQILQSFFSNGITATILAGEADVANPHAIQRVLASDLVFLVEPIYFTYDSNPALRGDALSPIRLRTPYARRQQEELQLLSGKGPLVGLHIRRTDYKCWSDGEHYYSDEVWKCELAHHRSLGRQAVIFTDEPEAALTESLCSAGAILSAGDPTEDFARLAQVDVIVGPPSTFSASAVCLAERQFAKAPVILRPGEHGWAGLPERLRRG